MILFINASRRSLLCTGLFALAILLTSGSTLIAQDTVAQDTVSSARTGEISTENAVDLSVDEGVDEEGLTEESKTEESKTEEQREKKAGTLVGIMMITLICITGVFLILWILLYGRWFRRMARFRTGPIAPPDPLWYLKEKANTEESNPEEPAPAEPTSTDEDEHHQDDEEDDPDEEKPSA